MLSGYNYIPYNHKIQTRSINPIYPSDKNCIVNMYYYMRENVEVTNKMLSFYTTCSKLPLNRVFKIKTVRHGLPENATIYIGRVSLYHCTTLSIHIPDNTNRASIDLTIVTSYQTTEIVIETCVTALVTVLC